MSIERLTAADLMMVRASSRWPQHVGALAILEGARLFEADGRFRIETLRAAIGAKLHLVPRFRHVIFEPRRGLGGLLWVDAQHFDLSEHVRVQPLPDDTGEAELLAATARLARQPLDASRPLWEMWFMPGLTDRRIGLFVRMHHAIADGTAAMTTVAALLDGDPDATLRAPVAWRPAPVPSAHALLADTVRRRAAQLAGLLSATVRPWITVPRVLAALPGAREMLAEEPGPKTSLDRMIGPDRNLALVRSSIDVLKEIAHTYDATVNDVLLTVTARGLRALLRSRGERVEDMLLPVYVPVSLRRGTPGVLRGNLITQMTVRLPLGLSDPVVRLGQIAATTAKVKAKGRPELGTLFRLIPTRLLLKAVAAQRVNVTTANIHGPELPLYLAGAQVLEVFPILPLIGTVALGVGGVSYAGAFDIAVVGDRAAYPDFDVLAVAIRDDLDALAASVRRASALTTRDLDEVHAGVPR
jgi:WS/DGAT/MGAT family acyltransferase